MTPQAQPGAEVTTACDASINEGFDALDAGSLGAAEGAFQHALGLTEGHTSPELIGRRIQALNGIGTLRRIQSRYQAAEEALREGIALAEAHLEPDASERILVLNQLAVTFKYTGNFDEAGQLYRQALAIIERTVGPEHS